MFNHSPVQTVHLIFKTHLDVGFTDFSASVVQNYFRSYIPKAIALAQELRERGADERFIWTTGSWLIYEYLEWADSQARRRMEQAIAAGDITWHALPFTTHTELMDVPLFNFGLSLSQVLDQRFGRHTTAAKMTDVPGHTRGIIPLLANAGVTFLHIGVNGASRPPDVPPVFRWRDPGSGKEILVMYHKGSYGDLMIVPKLADAIAFAHTGDNMGPQSADDLLNSYLEVRGQVPGAVVRASTMDAFAAQLATVRDSLPVLDREIGDTWIHGAGTDPAKVARFRALQRLHQQWRKDEPDSEKLDRFARRLLLVPEHTWGLDLKTHLGEFTHYNKAEFSAARGDPNYRKMEESWREQRGYIEEAVDALPKRLQEEARRALAELEPAPPDPAQYEPITDLGAPLEIGSTIIRLDPNHGYLTMLQLGGQSLAGPNNPIGKFWYETFSAADYARFHRQYNVNKRITRDWAIPDFTKPNLPTKEHETFLPILTFGGLRHEENLLRVLLLLDMPERATTVFGAPAHASLELLLSYHKPGMEFIVQWWAKPASRLPEALWFSFVPRLPRPRNWHLEKLGRWISPLEVVYNGNRHLHAVQLAARCNYKQTSVELETLDAPLVAPGEPSLINFTNRKPDLRKGLHVNLYNNLWGTNFPMWYDQDAKFRFRLSVKT